MTVMQLFSFFNSSTSYRVRIALALKGLDYQYHGVNIRIGEQASSSYIAMNPGKGVPVLIEADGTKITQSLAILSYLDSKYATPKLLPDDLLARTRILELCSVIGSDIHPVNNMKILKYLQGELAATEEQKNAWYAHWIAEGMSTVEVLLNEYGKGVCCFGDEPTLADVYLIPQVANALRMGCDMSPYPRALAIYEHCITLPAFVAAAPQQQPDVIR